MDLQGPGNGVAFSPLNLMGSHFKFATVYKHNLDVAVRSKASRAL